MCLLPIEDDEMRTRGSDNDRTVLNFFETAQKQLYSVYKKRFLSAVLKGIPLNLDLRNCLVVLVE